MSAEKIIQHMEEVMPLSKSELDLRSNGEGFGLIIVDEVNGFATVGRVTLLLKLPTNRFPLWFQRQIASPEHS
ncbi:MAG: hypothetical protein Ct9H300mP28_24840 [Pseudomonadota bacterium]|nr:MAG: hypothetical protein Ct9H300mP28_24840 [Pseudomonadota bacterium]